MDWMTLFFGGAGVVVTLALAAIGFFVAWGKINQTVTDQAGDISDLKETLKGQREDIDRAATAALEVKSLASAIEALTLRLSDGLGHIGVLFQQQNEHVKIQLNDIKDELRHRAAKPAEPRRRAN